MAFGPQGTGPQHPDRAAAGRDRHAGHAPGRAKRHGLDAGAGSAAVATGIPTNTESAGLWAAAIVGRRVPG